MTSHNTTFFGRKSELEECTRRLQSVSCRLLTILGAGGIGKTRFAKVISQSVHDSFTDGVIFVDLQFLDRSDQVLTAISHALPLDNITTDNSLAEIISHLQDKNVLLVLDNFEHALSSTLHISKRE